ncbi:MAG TPA: S1-like domain-containing RNA-binding protein [Bacillales bacterium]|nr:S1-like domain-containing RNA-binding protein [Bacillales bacterium]
MAQLQAGTVVELEVAREAPFGYFLTDGNEDVLLHETEAKGELAEDQTVEVFLYQDKKGRLAASMTIPDISIDTYEWVSVAGVQKHLGVFVDIGIKKDILLSVDDLPDSFEQWPEVGDQLYCSLKVDKKAGLLARLAGEEQMDEISRPAEKTMFNREIAGNVYRLVATGSFMISDDGLKGFIHETEQKEAQRLGKRVTGRVIGVKEDGTVNVSLLPRGYERIGDDAEKIMAHLESRNGPMPYSDRSHPDDIKARFSMSKGAFKRALGKLMKADRVYQEDGWTYLKDNRKK